MLVELGPIAEAGALEMCAMLRSTAGPRRLTMDENHCPAEFQLLENDGRFRRRWSLAGVMPCPALSCSALKSETHPQD